MVSSSNSSILARRSPMIRNLLGDCPVEETSIINDIESTILHCVLKLHNEINPTFPSRLYESVKVALEIFQIEQFVLVEELRPLPRKLSKPRKKRILSSSTIENINLDSMNINLVISYFGVRHKKILYYLAKTFPEHSLLSNTKFSTPD